MENLHYWICYLIKTVTYWCKNRQSQNNERIKSKAASPIPSSPSWRHGPNNNTGTNSLCERPRSQLIDFYTAGKPKEGKKTHDTHHNSSPGTIRRFPELSSSLVREREDRNLCLTFRLWARGLPERLVSVLP